MSIMGCSLQAGYSCRLEFHKLDDLPRSRRSVDGHSVEYIELGPGLPSVDKTKGAHSGVDPTDVSGDASQADRNARGRGDSRGRRSKRSTKGSKRTKVTSGSQAKKKKQNGKKPATGPKQKNVGSPGSISSAMAIPDGACGMSVHNNHLMFAFNSAAHPYQQHVREAGIEPEDSVHMMFMPGLATVPPRITDNLIYVIRDNK